MRSSEAILRIVLMDLLAGVMPAFMTYVSWSDEPKLNPTRQVYHCWLVVWALVPPARLFCWYALGRGPEVVATMTSHLTPAGRRSYEWQNFWRGPLVFWAVAAMVTVPPWLLATREQRHFDASISLLDGAAIKSIYGVPHYHDDERYRVKGTLRGTLRHWPGGDGKYESAGFVLALQDGPEIVVFVDVHRLKDVEKLVSSAKPGSLTCVVRMLGKGGREIPESFAKYYNWSEEDMSPPPEDAGKWTFTGKRPLTYYVDP
jgi:hypothetical protein